VNSNDQKIISKRGENYPDAIQGLTAEPPRRLFRFVRSFLEAHTGDRVLKRVPNGVSFERFRRILERENCSVVSVEVSEDEDTVFIELMFLRDQGRCTVVLTDLQTNDTYVRACFVARFDVDFEPEKINDLNMMSKFLKFYRVSDGRLFVEYSVLTIDLPDSAIATNVDMFHGAVNFIFRNRFSYAAVPAPVPGGDDRDRDAYATPATSQTNLDISRSDLNGIESKLDRISNALDRGPGGDLQAVINRLEDIRSSVRDISNKMH
jgi:hypothetical protein